MSGNVHLVNNRISEQWHISSNWVLSNNSLPASKFSLFSPNELRHILFKIFIPNILDALPSHFFFIPNILNAMP